MAEQEEVMRDRDYLNGLVAESAAKTKEQVGYPTRLGSLGGWCDSYPIDVCAEPGARA